MKKNLLKYCSLTLVFSIISTTFPAAITFADENEKVENCQYEETSDFEILSVVKSGQCGDNAYYSLSSDGTLTITGSGDMYDGDTPWLNYKTGVGPWRGQFDIFIKKVVVEGALLAFVDMRF